MARYEAYGWHTQHVDWTGGGNRYVEDVDALAADLDEAKQVGDRPSLIRLSTIIAWPAPTAQNTPGAHGAKLGAEEVAALKNVLEFDPDQNFVVEPEVLTHTRGLVDRGAKAHADRSEERRVGKEWRRGGGGGEAEHKGEETSR